MAKRRPGSADGEKPTSMRFVRPCKKDPPSAPASPTPRRASKPTSLEKLIPVKVKFDRPCYPESDNKSRPLYDYGPTKFTRPASVKMSKPEVPPPAAKYTPNFSRQTSSGSFNRWGSPYPETCRKSVRACSPDLTNVFSHTGCAFATTPKRSPLWQNSTEDIRKFFNGSSLTSRRMMQMTSCAAAARAPFPMSRARKLVFYQRVDKETFVEELEALKHAVADQAYHFQLHRVHIHQLRAQHHRLEEKLAAIESIDGSNAPRTGGASRLSSKVAGMKMKIICLEENITDHAVNIQNLKYRYQVCLTREAYIQRDATAQHARRIQKEQRVLAKLLKELTAENKKFRLLRDTILPEQKAWKKQKEDDIEKLKRKMRDTDTLSRESTNETYNNKSLAAKAVNQAYYLVQEGKSLRAKLKYEREWKRKAQEEIWAKAYDTCILEKGNRRTEKLRRAQENEARKKEGN